MANHWRSGNASTMHHSSLDALNWPVLGVSVLSWPWLGTLWSYAPTLTGLYMALSAAFMLFQMSDKLGLLERFKRQPKPEQKQ
jgi:hypothetical protein